MKNFFSFLNKKFEVGDIVSVKGQQDDIFFKGAIGIIICINKNNFLVKFDNKFSIHLHGGNGMDISKCSYWVEIKNLKHVPKSESDKRKKHMMEIKMKHIEIDPYDEENWD